MTNLKKLSIEQLTDTSAGISLLFEYFFISGNADSITQQDQINLYCVGSLQRDIQTELRKRILNKIGQIEFESNLDTV